MKEGTAGVILSLYIYLVAFMLIGFYQVTKRLDKIIELKKKEVGNE